MVDRAAKRKITEEQRLTKRIRGLQRRAEARKKALCTRCLSPEVVVGRVRCQKCIDEDKQRVLDLKQLVINKYGGQICACCLEYKKNLCFLQIDHIHGGGRKHKRDMSINGGTAFYKWLKRNNFPPGYQVLCCCCNFGKGQYGECPHKAERRNLIEEVTRIPLTY
jgi:hypothetical protein